MEMILKVFNIPKRIMMKMGMDEGMATLVQWFLYIGVVCLFICVSIGTIDNFIIK